MAVAFILIVLYAVVLNTRVLLPEEVTHFTECPPGCNIIKGVNCPNHCLTATVPSSLLPLTPVRKPVTTFNCKDFTNIFRLQPVMTKYFYSKNITERFEI